MYAYLSKTSLFEIEHKIKKGRKKGKDEEKEDRIKCGNNSWRKSRQMKKKISTKRGQKRRTKRAGGGE
jgi:hypothetical protein